MDTILVAILGFLTVGLSLRVAFYFSGRTRRAQPGTTRQLMNSLTFVFLGEAIVGFAILTTAALDVAGLWDSFSHGQRSAMRFAMFTVSFGTTLQLTWTLHRISKL
jgi:hypothetical protein